MSEKNILQEIVDRRKEDIKKSGWNFGYEIPSERKRKIHSFLETKGVVLEVKRASPSKGDIAPELDSGKTARSYCEAGAKAISCLTETNYFKGTLSDLMKVCDAVDAYEEETGTTGPAVLRKDFLIDEKEIEIAYRCGADAVLLISRILPLDKMISMAKKCEELQITALVELRLDEDVQKLAEVVKHVDKRFIVSGVNSRDLRTFSINLLTPCAMLNKIRNVLGSDARVIFESGIRTPESASFAGSLGFAGMLLGEAAAKNPELRKSLVTSFVNSDSESLYGKKIVALSEKISERGNRPLVKICGLTNADDVKLAASLGADFTGFIFAAGFGRNVCGEKFDAMKNEVKEVNAFKVAVITDADSPEAETAVRLVEEGVIDFIQLHGISYSDVPEKILRLPHYFAVTSKEKISDDETKILFEKGEPRFLQDCRKNQYAETEHLWLAGGVTAENAAALIGQFNPELVDVSSGIESETLGKKDEEKLRAFFSAIKQSASV